nr:MAG TPA: hypothetical protein [Caudoviricetes sp.]
MLSCKYNKSFPAPQNLLFLAKTKYCFLFINFY